MEDWRRILAHSVVKPRDLAERLGVDEKEIESIVGDYPMRITPTVWPRSKKKEMPSGSRSCRIVAEMADADAEDDPLKRI